MTVKTIQNVLDDCLCSGCGGCAGICPKKAITMIRNSAGFLHAQINQEKCVNCGKCICVCPSTGNNALTIMNNPLKVLIGHAKNESVRCKGQSGGVVTAILLYMLQMGIVDGAVVTHLNDGKPETIYTEDSSVIRNTAGSVYAQTSVAETALQIHGKRMAIVALGCQAKAVRKAMNNYRKDLEDSIIIGLICGGNMSLQLKDVLIKKKHRKSHITDFRYRDKEHTGWPGAPSYIVNGNRILLENSERIRLKPIYECYRCSVCPDKMNPLCDIVVGDPWGLIEGHDGQGESIAIAYSDVGAKILASVSSYVEFQTADIQKIKDGQGLKEYHERLCQLSNHTSEFKVPFLSTYNSDTLLSEQMKERLRWDRNVYNSCSMEEASFIRKNKFRKENNQIKERLYSIKINMLTLIGKKTNGERNI